MSEMNRRELLRSLGAASAVCAIPLPALANRPKVVRDRVLTADDVWALPRHSTIDSCIIYTDRRLPNYRTYTNSSIIGRPELEEPMFAISEKAIDHTLIMGNQVDYTGTRWCRGGLWSESRPWGHDE